MVKICLDKSDACLCHPELKFFGCSTRRCLRPRQVKSTGPLTSLKLLGGSDLAKGKSARRGAANGPDPMQIEHSVLFGPDDDPVESNSGSANAYLVDNNAPLRSSEGATSDDEVPNYKDALSSVADRYLAKSSEPQTQPAPDRPLSDLQTPDKSSEAPPASPSPKPQVGRARRLASGQWVTK